MAESRQEFVKNLAFIVVTLAKKQKGEIYHFEYERVYPHDKKPINRITIEW